MNVHKIAKADAAFRDFSETGGTGAYQQLTQLLITSWPDIRKELGRLKALKKERKVDIKILAAVTAVAHKYGWQESECSLADFIDRRLRELAEMKAAEKKEAPSGLYGLV